MQEYKIDYTNRLYSVVVAEPEMEVVMQQKYFTSATPRHVYVLQGLRPSLNNNALIQHYAADCTRLSRQLGLVMARSIESTTEC